MLKCWKLNGLNFRKPLKALLSTKQIKILVGSCPRITLSKVSPRIPVCRVNDFTSTRVMGYLAMLRDNAFACAS